MRRGVEPYYRDIGLRVRQLRTNLGLSQEQLGKALSPGITRASIANIEAGQQRMLVHTLLGIAAALKVPITDLLPGSSPAAAQQIDANRLAKELSAKLTIPSKKARALAAQLDGRQSAAS